LGFDHGKLPPKYKQDVLGREEERIEKKWGEMRDTTLVGGKKVPRQYPFVFMVEVMHIVT
jgi:hypothetical protein